MIKAEQLHVIQNTNAFLANNIRAAELDFYSSIYRYLSDEITLSSYMISLPLTFASTYFSNFGVMAITLAGFSLSSLQQVTSTGFDTQNIQGEIYFVIITILILASIHLSMSTMCKCAL
jgi:hypothetical protein